MKHSLYIKHLGPIEACRIEIGEFTVFTGPQSNGKSTVAKAIYYFRSIKQDILNLMLQGGPVISTGNPNAKWYATLQQRLRNKFFELFGTSWIMESDMTMEYTFSAGVYIRVFLKDRIENLDKNYVSFDFSQKLEEYIHGLDSHTYDHITVGQRVSEEKALDKLFDDEFEPVFIPAGRNLITLLSTQLNYIFTSLEASQLRNIDYITKRYTELILKLKPSFSQGARGVIEQAANAPEQGVKYKKNRTVIDLLTQKAKDILRGEYRYVDGEERLYLDQSKYIKINFASSGQQETVWVFNLLLYYLLEDRKVFLIIEEPESHLFPNSQQDIAEILALFFNAGNHVLVTTHSPYVLGTFNYLMLAGQSDKSAEEEVKSKLHQRFWLKARDVSALYIGGGTSESALDDGDGVLLIKNELIDEASRRINEISDFVIEQTYPSEG